MFIINTIILSLTICIDSFLLCLFNKSCKKKDCFFIPLIFSFFQVSFLLVGYFIGDFIEIYLVNYIKYIIFIIFSSMAVKLIIDALVIKGEEINCNFSIKYIALQALISSFDSLFLGLPFAFNCNSYLILSTIVAITTFIVCLLGLLLKNKIKSTHEDKISLIGALILFIFAFKSLI